MRFEDSVMTDIHDVESDEDGDFRDDVDEYCAPEGYYYHFGPDE